MRLPPGIASSKASGAIIVIACAFIATLAQVRIADPDVFWHLRVGQWIVAHHAVPTTDVYSWSANGQPWMAHEWGWEVLMWAAHSAMGIRGLWLLVLVAAFLVGSIVRRALCQHGVSAENASIAGGMAVLLLVGWLRPWPQACVYLLFGCYLYLSLQPRWGRRQVAMAGLVALLWANIHSTAVMLPLLLATEAVWAGFVARRDDTGMLVGGSLAAAAATLVNPHGVGLWVYAVREGLLSQRYREYIIEWKPMDFGGLDLVLVFLVCLAVLFVAVAQRRETQLVFLRAAGFWVLALLSRIYMPYAVMSTAVLMGTLNLRLDAGSGGRLGLVSSGLAVFLALSVLGGEGLPSDLEELARKGGYPVRGADFVLQQGAQRLYNDYGVGGYLIWRGIPVYIDGRADLYGKRILEDFALLEKEAPAGETIERLGADMILARSGSCLDAALKDSDLWREAFRDKSGVVYVPALR